MGGNDAWEAISKQLQSSVAATRLSGVQSIPTALASSSMPAQIEQQLRQRLLDTGESETVQATIVGVYSQALGRGQRFEDLPSLFFGQLWDARPGGALSNTISDLFVADPEFRGYFLGRIGKPVVEHTATNAKRSLFLLLMQKIADRHLDQMDDGAKEAMAAYASKHRADNLEAARAIVLRVHHYELPSPDA